MCHLEHWESFFKIITYYPSEESRNVEEGKDIITKLEHIKEHLGILVGNAIEMTALTPVWGLNLGRSREIVLRV